MGLQNAFVQSNIHISARLLPSVVRAVVTGTITHRKQQGAIGAEHQRAHRVRFMNDRDPGLGCFAQEDQPTFRINTVETISRSNGVSGHSTNGRTVILVDSGFVLSCTGEQKVVAIDGIQQVDPTVLPEPRVQSHTKQTMVPPSAHLIRDDQDGLGPPRAVRLDRPDFSGAFPRVRPSGRVKGHPHQLVPTGGHPLLVEPLRKQA